MKNRKRLLALALVGVMSLGMLLSGCGGTSAQSPSPSPSASAPAESTPAEGFDMAVCIASEPQTIDPALNSAVDGAIMTQHMFEGLMKWVDSGNPVNDKGNMNYAALAAGQAESYEKTDNGDGTVTYTFKIRSDAKWSDGQPVTANDFVYSWQRLANPLTAADYCYMIDMVQGYAAVNAGEADPTTLGVSAPDESTFVVNLTYDCPYFLEICAFPAAFPVRQDIIEAYGDTWTTDDNSSHYISNGPWKLAEWVHDSYIKMVPNEYHYDAANLGPNSLTFQLMEDQNSMLAAYRSGDLQFIEDMPVDEIAGLLASGELNIVDYIGTYYVCYQTQAAPFDNALVRQAFTLAIDSKYIVEQVTQTGQVPATGFVPAGIYDADPNGDDFRTVGGDYWDAPVDDATYQANCEKARQLLAEAGYPNGEGFPTVTYLYNTSDAHKAVGEALQQMWQEELGVTVQLQNQEWNAFLETRKKGEYQIARNGWIADYNDPCSFLDMWYTGGGNNDAQYSNPEYDAMIDAAKATSDPAERMSYFHKAEDIIIGQDWALGPIYFYTQKYMMADGISGAFYTPLGYFIYGYCTKG
ncbi:MAG: peptide ABC transporter substrate-binding protein [Intestinimonas massiliensis]|uniref:peptide ABC transporter substrate-binding protein n=1 Tax=Intestinimonas TaxID=1392389 RepID=UPI00242EF690|nr:MULTISPECIES: peptide ABC transporter substrate-binding protein [Intestinimonas]MCI5562988.1 peptide ABC transporter substrate-binding protein [Intestinimonas massiliensis (ex Afouda et al. 2020)]MDY5339503.1 peptide ABC transporter substrate-binding protein [Intestinimonas sp.]